MDNTEALQQRNGMARFDVDAAKWLPEITRRVVEAVHPEAIWLFGSRAQGTACADADVDLLVVLPQLSATRRAHALALRRILADIPVPKDVVVASAGEFAEKRTVWGTLPFEAAEHGRPLYVA